ncbi:peptidoglycan-binding protein [Streptomyces oryzae]|uniref:Peptidoglycan-binding protein n=1 Tax=Streptomyces oryzae TaxID=1434886 RepID=A0ABS3XM06_9ACTN|nr:peptidoglycan-binding protein [Streptomyces oryzae]MBO8196429.1 peptidoglycan-binding protein [Streptomyces oryzae]
MAGDGRSPERGRSAESGTHTDAAAGGGEPFGGGEPAGHAEPAHEPEDPLHIRPYVQLREGGTAQAPQSPQAPQAPHEQAAERAPGQLPGTTGDAHVPLPDLSPFAEHGTEETAELPAVTGSDGGRDGGQDGGRGGGRAGLRRRVQPSGAADRTSASHRRVRERRRPSTAVFAGVGVAAVLGGGLLTTQVMTDDGSRAGDGRALPHMPTGAPTEDDDLPSPSPSTEQQPERSSQPKPAPSRSAAPGTPRAGRDGGEHTTRPSPTRAGKSHSGRPVRPGEGQRGYGRPHQQWPGHSSGQTLRPGDSGTEVVELQRRLKEAGYYDRSAPEDGVYSSQVQQAVFQYQAHYHLWDDAPGEYGPATRRHLEARTSG